MVILVVVDDIHLRFAVFQSFRQDGHTVLHAGNPKSAIAILDDFGSDVDLLVTTHQPPEIDGLHLHRHLLNKIPKMSTVLLLEAGAQKEEVESERLPFLQRPFTESALRSAAAAVFTSSAAN